MALETLGDVNEIGGFGIMHFREGKLQNAFPEENGFWPIAIDHDKNTINFTIQNGPIKENGVNGCQVDTLIATALHIIKKLDDHFPCEHNVYAISHLGSALHWLGERTKDRKGRNVEGQSKI